VGNYGTGCVVSRKIAFIGSAGIPNRYGGFESFLEQCAPEMVRLGCEVTVTCDRRLYPDGQASFNGVACRYIGVPANGGASVLHDLVAFLVVLRPRTDVFVLGVSGGVWFPLFRLLCEVMRCRLIVNVDGVEWRRSKFGFIKRGLLRVFDHSAQMFAHKIVYDNVGLKGFVLPSCVSKAECIAYSGDHVLRLSDIERKRGHGLTVCRIEPENNLELLIEGFLGSSAELYTVVGNWGHSVYAQTLRAKYAGVHRLRLLDPIYDPSVLASMRGECDFYLHGHSVGGTNPSLVEMLFYDCCIFCLDVPFNRYTAGEGAEYFSNSSQLAELINSPTPVRSSQRSDARCGFTAFAIAVQYLAI
jgi:glycosyltransferase involved in cell wall biosynthesis